MHRQSHPPASCLPLLPILSHTTTPSCRTPLVLWLVVVSLSGERQAGTPENGSGRPPFLRLACWPPTPILWYLRLWSCPPTLHPSLALVLLLPPSLVVPSPCHRPSLLPWNTLPPCRFLLLPPLNGPAHCCCQTSSSFDCCVLFLASVALLPPCCCPLPLPSNTTATIVAPAHCRHQTPSSRNCSPSLFVDCCVRSWCRCLPPLPCCYLAVIHHHCHQMPSNAATAIERVVAGGGWGWWEWRQQPTVVSRHRKGQNFLMSAQANTIRCQHCVFWVGGPIWQNPKQHLVSGWQVANMSATFPKFPCTWAQGGSSFFQASKFFFIFSSCFDYINLYKFCELSNFYFRS